MHTHPSHFPLHNHWHPRHFLLCKRKRPMPLSMEEEKSMEISISSSGGTPSTSRWNPTKEQISLLEGLYNQGIRTPSAEQIQQITSRLRAYGHIEGKNVFYWFQNHKARQRQKQKQESMMIVNRILHKASPILAPHPCTNVVYGPYCIPQPPMSFYPQCPTVLPPGGMRRARGEKPQEKKNETHVEEHEFPHSNPDIMALDYSLSPETLQLFPLHPTGILETRSENASPSPSTQTSNIEEINGEQTLFNFWSSDNGSCRSW